MYLSNGVTVTLHTTANIWCVLYEGTNFYDECCSTFTSSAKFYKFVSRYNSFAAGANLVQQSLFSSLHILKPVFINFKGWSPFKFKKHIT
jgi:hypothetical protein